MAIHHEVTLVRAGSPRLAVPKPGGGGRFGEHDGVAVSRTEARVEADLFAMFDEPRGASRQMLPVLWLRGDAWETHVIAKFVHEPLLVPFQIIQYNIHAREYRKTKFKAKQIEVIRTS